MSTVRWKAGSVNVAATGSYHGGALPVSGDELHFDEGVDAGAMTNTATLAAVDLLTLRMLQGSAINLGSAANPFQCIINQTSTGYFENISKAAEVWLSGGGSGVIYEVRFRPARFCHMRLAGCVNSIIRSLGGGGILTVTGTSTVVAVEALGPGSVVLQEHGSDVTGAVTVSGGGLVEARRRIAAASTVGGGGKLTYDVDTTTASSAIGIDGGGQVDLVKGSIEISGKNGVLDCRRLEKSGFTITGTAYPGLTLYLGANAPTLSYTAVSGGPSIIRS